MDRETLLELLIAQDPKALADQLVELEEKDRLTFGKVVAKTVRELDARLLHQKSKSIAAEEIDRFFLEKGIKEEEIEKRVRKCLHYIPIAIVACCSLSEVKKNNLNLRKIFNRERPGFFSQVYRIFSLRDKKFLDQILDHYITTETTSGAIDWDVVAKLAREGHCTLPPWEKFVPFLVDSVAYQYNYSKEKERELIHKELEQVPRFLEEDVYQFFQVETMAFAFDWGGWPEFLKLQFSKKRVDQNRFLKAALKGLMASFKKNVISGTVKFIESLEITEELWVKNNASIYELLHSDQSNVVKFSLKHLKKLNLSGKIDRSEMLERISSGFQSPAKGNAKTTFTIIQKAVTKQPELIPFAVGPVIAALSHPEPEIVTKAVDLLEECREHIHVDHRSEIANISSSVPPMLTSRLEGVIAGSSGQDDSLLEKGEIEDLQTNIALAIGEAKKLPEPIRKLAGLDSDQFDLSSAEFPKALDLPFAEISILEGLQQIEPIIDHQQLIDCIARCLENVEDPMDVERVLDGIVRLGPVTESCSLLAAPVIKRLYALPAGESGKGLTNTTDCANIINLIERFFQSSAPERGKDAWRFQFVPADLDRPETRWFKNRIVELCEAFDLGHRFALISMPTHQSGWIDPVAFAQRVNDRGDSELPFMPHDFILALFRLAPDRRQQALDHLNDDESTWTRLARVALGGKIGDTASLKCVDFESVCAAVVIRGEAIDEKLARELGIPKGIAQSDRPLKVLDFKQDLENYTEVRFRRTKPFDSGSVLKDLFRFGSYKFDSFSRWMVGILSTTAKSHPEAFLGYALNAMAGNVRENSKTYQPFDAFLEILFQPNSSWSQLDYMLASIGSLSKSSDIKIQVVDALCEAVLDGRACPKQFGEAISIAIDCQIGGNLKRLAEVLQELEQISTFHCWFVAITIESLIENHPKLPAGSVQLFELLQSSLSKMGLSPTESVVNRLKEMKGSSRSAKLAKEIVGTSNPANPEIIAASNLLAFQARIERAQTWQSE